MDHEVGPDFEIMIPKQVGMRFELHANCQNGDELHFGTTDFTASTFPVSDETKFENAMADIGGLITGKSRIMVSYFNQGSFLDSRLENCVDGVWHSTRRYGAGCNFLSLFRLRPKPSGENTKVYWNGPAYEEADSDRR